MIGANAMAANNQSFTSVYQEKKISGYEGWFKESSFSKPVNVYLTITVAHIFGEAYIMEQEGTKEGDPVYQRFICPLEEITKVYVNEGVKSNPLFIQCDTDIKGVIHRKRIIIPCLDKPQDIVSEIEKVRAAHTAKIEEALEHERKRKAEASAEKKKAEAQSKPEEKPKKAEKQEKQTKAEEQEIIPPLPKLDPVIEAAVQARMSGAAAEPVKDIRTVLVEDLETDLKALEKISAGLTDDKPEDSIEEVKSTKKKPPKVKASEPDLVPDLEVKKAKPKKAKVDIPDEVEELSAEDMTEAARILEEIAHPADIPDQVDEIVTETVDLPDAVGVPVNELPEIVLPDTPDEEYPDYQPVDAVSTIPDIGDAPGLVPDTAVVTVYATYEEASPEAEAEPEQIRHAGALASFEEAVIALNQRRMNGELSDEEYIAQRKQLINNTL